MAEQKQQKFELHKVYVKDMSFESPMAPNIFTDESAHPSIDVQLNVRRRDLGQDMYESTVVVTVNGKLGERDAFLVEVQQAGVFEIAGFEPDKGLNAALEVACPNMLFPFAREAVNDLVTRGGFPQLLLAPVNFESIFRRKAEKSRNEESSNAEQDSSNTEAGAPESGSDKSSS